MIDVIDSTATITNFAKGFDDFEDVGGLTAFSDQVFGIFVIAGAEIFVIKQHRGASHFFATHTTVELHAAYIRQVVTLEGEEQVIEQVQRGFFCWRLAWTHHAINFDQCFELGLAWVDTQCV